MTLRASNHAEPFKGGAAAFAQVGWLGQSGRVYGLNEESDGDPADHERGGFQPIFVRIGCYEIDDAGVTRLED